MTDEREATRALLQQMMAAAGVTDLTALARKAGMAHTTLTRGSKDGVPHNLSSTTWMKLSSLTGIPVTFLGEQIVISGSQPCDGDPIKALPPPRLIRFWGLLQDDERSLVLDIVDRWAERIIQGGPSRS